LPSTFTHTEGIETMEMGSIKEIESIALEGEVYQCPSCGYRDGFHLSFKWDQNDVYGEIYLICPNCHARYRTGWKIKHPFRETGRPFPEPDIPPF